MLIAILEVAFVVFVFYGLLRWAVSAWRKADVVAKADELETLDEAYQVVKVTEGRHRNTDGKRETINKFKSK